jgi:hypothetical protein
MSFILSFMSQGSHIAMDAVLMEVKRQPQPNTTPA